MDYLLLMKQARLETISEEQPPPPKIKCKDKQSVVFLTAFRDKLNESESELSKYLNKKKCKTLILSNGGLEIKYCF